MSERERIAAELHEQYLATARRLNWPLRPDVDRPYEQLSDAAKELDRVFADWHLAELERHQAAAAKAIREAAIAIQEFPTAKGAKWFYDHSETIQRAREQEGK